MKRLIAALILTGLVLAAVLVMVLPTGSAPVAVNAPAKPAPSLVKFGITPTIGQVLHSSTGTWTNTPSSFTYQWQQCNSSGASCTNISGETASTYTVASGDSGHTIRVVVTATNSSGSGSSTSAATGVIGSSTFVAGVCSPSPCTQVSETGYTITSVPDSDATPYSLTANTPATASKTLYIERPTNLASSPAPPMVISTFGPVANNPNWQAAAAKYGFVLMQLNPYNSGYHSPTTSWDGIHMGPSGTFKVCGSGSTHFCDDIPWLIKALDAVDCPYTGSGPCQGINPDEVFITTASNGNFASAAACDTRTSARIAGVQTVSDDMFGTAIASGTATRVTAKPPNCPAILGVTTPFGQDCFSDCALSPLSVPNADVSYQWVYGTSDSLFPGLGTTGATQNCTVSNTALCWAYSAADMAGADSRGVGAAMGCPSTAASNVTLGLTSKVTVSTYTPCSDSSSPSQAAMQIVKITGAGHVPDTWPIGANSAAYIANSSYVVNGVCTSTTLCPTGSRVAASDGVSTPDIAWTFWTQYFK